MNRYTLSIIGNGRAGKSFAVALKEVGHEVFGPFQRGFADNPDFQSALNLSQAVIIAVNDSNISGVANQLQHLMLCSFSSGQQIQNPKPVVIHLSGSKGLDILGELENKASIHPVAPLPNAETGSKRLLSNISFAVSGDERAKEIVESLGGNCLNIADEDRALYHATCSVASNFVVGLAGQVEKMAYSCGLELADFIKLAEFSLADVKNYGVNAALTGPVVRKDFDTVEMQRNAIKNLDKSELEYFDAGIKNLKELSQKGELLCK